LNGKNNKKVGLGARCIGFYVFNKMSAPIEVKYSNWNNESGKIVIFRTLPKARRKLRLSPITLLTGLTKLNVDRERII
jgi:hypothetical protein